MICAVQHPWAVRCNAKAALVFVVADIQLIALDEVLTPEDGVTKLAQLAMVRDECVDE